MQWPDAQLSEVVHAAPVASGATQVEVVRSHSPALHAPVTLQSWSPPRGSSTHAPC